MPDKDGILSPEEKQRAVDWIKERGHVLGKCPICDSQEWFIADHLVMPITVGGGGSLLLGGPGYPQIMIVSKKCGYTRFLNAVMIGISPPQKTEPNKAEEAEKKS